MSQLWIYHEANAHEPEEKMNTEGWVGDVPRTWGEQAARVKEGLLNQFRYGSESFALSYWPNREGLAEERAQELVDQLISEVNGMETLWQTVTEEKLFATPPDSAHPLEIGDSPLVPRVGWQADYDVEKEAFDRQLRKSIAEGNPSLKAIRPELFPSKIDIQGNVIVHKDGSPFIPSTTNGEFVRLIDFNGDPIPLVQDESGKISIPTPTDLRELQEIHETEKTLENSP